MKPPVPRLVLALALCVAPAIPESLRAQETEKALELLNRRCVECHGPTRQSGKLRLDSIDAVFKGGKSGPPIVSGKSSESLLYERITAADAKKRMPPKGDALSEQEVEAIRSWIDSGARAAAATSGEPPKETVTPRADRLPQGFAPVFCLAGDPSSARLAVGRGTIVEVHEIMPGDAAKKTAPTVKLAKALGGHSDIVQCVAFSQDGKRLASGEYGIARVWSTDSWELLRELKPHADRVLAVAFSPDGKKLVAGGGLPAESGEVKLWDLDSAQVVWSVTPHSDTVLGLAWSADGKTILTGAADRVTYLLDPGSGKSVRRLEAHTHHVLSVAISPDGKRGATSGADRVIKLWDLEKGELVKNARGNEKPVTSVAFHDDGKKLASTGGDGQARFWEWENARERFNLSDAKGYLQGGAFLSGEKLYATAEQDGPVRVYDVESRKLIATITPTPPAEERRAQGSGE